MHSKQLKQLQKVLLTTLVFIVISLFILSTPTKDEVHVYFFNIRQGDASMITLPDNVYILIDG